jgi:hypothetical protein
MTSESIILACVLIIATIFFITGRFIEKRISLLKSRNSMHTKEDDIAIRLIRENVDTDNFLFYEEVGSNVIYMSPASQDLDFELIYSKKDGRFIKVPREFVDLLRSVKLKEK